MTPIHNKYLPIQQKTNYLNNIFPYQGRFHEFTAPIWQILFSCFTENKLRELRLINKNWAFTVIDHRIKTHELKLLKDTITSLTSILKQKNYCAESEKIRGLENFLDPENLKFLSLSDLEDYIFSIRNEIMDILKTVKSEDLKTVKTASHSVLKVLQISYILQNNQSDLNNTFFLKETYHANGSFNRLVYLQITKDQALESIHNKNLEGAIHLLNTLANKQEFLKGFQNILDVLILKNDLETAIILISKIVDEETKLLFFSNTIIPHLIKNDEIHKSYPIFLNAIYNIANARLRNEIYLKLASELFTHFKFDEASKVHQLYHPKLYLDAKKIWITYTPHIKINPDFENLGNFKSFISDIFHNIFMFLSQKDIQVCTLLNKNWNKLTVKTVGTIEFTKIINIKKIVFNSLNSTDLDKIKRHTQTCLNCVYPSINDDFHENVQNLSFINRLTDSRIKILLEKMSQLDNSFFELFTSELKKIPIFYFQGNFYEVLTVYKEISGSPNVYSLTDVEKWMEILFKNKDFPKMTSIIEHFLSNNYEEAKIIYKKYVMKLFEAGHENAALYLAWNTLSRHSCNNEVVKELIEKDMIPQAIRIIKRILHLKEPFLTCAKALIDKQKANEIFVINPLIFEQEESFVIHVMTLLIESGNAPLVTDKVKKITKIDLKKTIIKDWLVDLLLEKNLVKDVLDLLEEYKPTLTPTFKKSSTMQQLELYKQGSDKLKALGSFQFILGSLTMTTIPDKQLNLEEAIELLSIAKTIKDEEFQQKVYLSLCYNLIRLKNSKLALEVADLVKDAITQQNLYFSIIKSVLIEENIDLAIELAPKAGKMRFDGTFIYYPIVEKLIVLKDYEKIIAISNEHKNSIVLDMLFPYLIVIDVKTAIRLIDTVLLTECKALYLDQISHKLLDQNEIEPAIIQFRKSLNISFSKETVTKFIEKLLVLDLFEEAIFVATKHCIKHRMHALKCIIKQPYLLNKDLEALELIKNNTSSHDYFHLLASYCGFLYAKGEFKKSLDMAILIPDKELSLQTLETIIYESIQKNGMKVTIDEILKSFTATSFLSQVFQNLAEIFKNQEDLENYNYLTEQNLF